MFENCRSLTRLDLGKLGASNSSISYLVNGCSKLKSVFAPEFKIDEHFRDQTIFQGAPLLREISAAPFALALNYMLPFSGEWYVDGQGPYDRSSISWHAYDSENGYGVFTRFYDIQDLELGEFPGPVYTGSPIIPDLTITHEGMTLKPDVDYTFSFEDNINAGKASFTITGIGEYRGERKCPFDILPAPLDQVQIEGVQDSYTETGSAILPSYSLTFNGSPLEEGKDFTASLENNTTPGTAILSLTGTGNFTGEKSVSFTIVAKTPIADVSVTGIEASYPWNGLALKPVPVLTFNGKTLVENTDYTLAWKDNTDPGTGKVIITGQGSYTGTREISFQIEKKAEQPAPDPKPDPKPGPKPKPEVKSVSVSRLYNPNSGEHFFTSDQDEKKVLISLGWKDEGEGWKAPGKSGIPVYRLYNPNAGDHHYTADKKEKDILVKLGWKDEGIGWYSDEAKGVSIYRQYNPNARTGTHHFTADEKEHKALSSIGWKEEGIAWYALQ